MNSPELPESPDSPNPPNAPEASRGLGPRDGSGFRTGSPDPYGSTTNPDGAPTNPYGTADRQAAAPGAPAPANRSPAAGPTPPPSAPVYGAPMPGAPGAAPGAYGAPAAPGVPPTYGGPMRPGGQMGPGPGGPVGPGYGPGAAVPGAAPLGAPPARRPARGLAITALVVGIVALALGLVPFLGVILGLGAIALGVIALVKGGSKPMSITGAALGAGAVIISSIATLGLVAMSLTTPVSPTEPAATQAAVETTRPATEAPATQAPVATTPPAPAVPDLSTFAEVDERTFALTMKDPDAHAGTNLIAYGVVTQFDAATGKCMLRMNTGASITQYSYDYDQNTVAASGDGSQVCPVFDNVVQDDHLRVWATVVGSVTYDTTVGGATTVPLITIWQVELLDPQEY